MTAEAGELIEERRNHRRAVIRQALLYTPGAILVPIPLAIAIGSVLQGQYGALIAGTILLLIEIALLFQAVAALRDLRAQPRTTTGMIRRAWSKGIVLGFIRSHYLLVERSVFDVSVVTYSLVTEGDNIEVKHWPHTKTVIEIRKLKRTQVPQDAPRFRDPYRSPTDEAKGSLDVGIGRIQNTPFEGPFS